MPLGAAVAFYAVGGDALVTQDYEALDDIVQLAYVARPGARAEHLNGGAIYLLGGDIVARAYLVDEVLDKERYVVASIAQRRYIYLYDTQAVV